MFSWNELTTWRVPDSLPLFQSCSTNSDVIYLNEIATPYGGFGTTLFHNKREASYFIFHLQLKSNTKLSVWTIMKIWTSVCVGSTPSTPRSIDKAIVLSQKSHIWTDILLVTHNHFKQTLNSESPSQGDGSETCLPLMWKGNFLKYVGTTHHFLILHKP